jgi:hypothetical protein
MARGWSYWSRNKLEILTDLGHHARLVLAEVELDVGGEPGIGEVRRPGDNALVVIGDCHVGLAMQEPVGKPMRLRLWSA